MGKPLTDDGRIPLDGGIEGADDVGGISRTFGQINLSRFGNGTGEDASEKPDKSQDSDIRSLHGGCVM